MRCLTRRMFLGGWLMALIILTFGCGPKASSVSAIEFEEILSNPLLPRDHSERVDRLTLTDSVQAFRAGATKSLRITEDPLVAVILAESEPVVYPHRGSWTSPEISADFPFTELIPSWNGSSPPNTGYFVQVRTRDKSSQEWSPWLFVGRWGRTIHNRRDESLPREQTFRFRFGAVRTDMPLVLLQSPADAYQIRAILQSFDLDPAVNPSIRRVAVAYSGQIRDRAERARLTDANIRLKIPCELDIPHVSQFDGPKPLREAICMPASVTMVLAYFKMDRSLTEISTAIYDPDSGMFGNGARAVACGGELGLDGWMQRVNNWNQVSVLLTTGQAVIAAVRIQGAEHLVVIRGLSADGQVLINDPAERSGKSKAWNGEELARAWFGSGGICCVFRKPAAR